MLLFKLNQLDESLITDDVYILSCVVNADRKYITSIIGKKFMQKDNTLEKTPDIYLSTSLAYMYNPDIVLCTSEMLDYVVDILNKEDVEVYVDASTTIITKEDQIITIEIVEDMIMYKIQLLRRINSLIKKCIPTTAITSFISCSLHVQKMILDGTITINLEPLENNNRIKIIEYITTNTQFKELNNILTNILTELPLDKLPVLKDLNFETISEENISLLDSYLQDINKLTNIIEIFYNIVVVILNTNDLTMLKELEKKFISFYYYEIGLLI